MCGTCDAPRHRKAVQDAVSKLVKDGPDLVPRLSVLAELRDAIDAEIDAEIHLRREQAEPFTWELIGKLLGVTKQAASQRHKRATRLF